MPDRAVLLQELLELLQRRANYLSIPELRGRTRQGQPADLTVRANVALACGLDVDMHHGSPCVVVDRQAFNAAREAGERMPPGAWDGVGHYFTSITDIERHLLPASLYYNVVRHPGILTEDGPKLSEDGDLRIGHAVVEDAPRVEAITPARALLTATLLWHALEAGLDVA
jgi:hypothetical protein